MGHAASRHTLDRAAIAKNEDLLIAEHVESDSSFRPYGVADARLTRGTPIWTLVKYLSLASGNQDLTAEHYGLHAKEMAAALAYYRRHKKAIDARVALYDS